MVQDQFGFPLVQLLGMVRTAGRPWGQEGKAAKAAGGVLAPGDAAMPAVHAGPFRGGILNSVRSTSLMK